MPFFGKSSKNRSVGVYLGDNQLSIAQLDEDTRKKAVGISRSASVKWDPSDVTVPIGERLKELMASCGIKSRSIALALSGSESFIRRYEMPMLPKKEWHVSARFEARKYIPFEVSELCCGTDVHKAPGGKRLEVVFSGIKRSVLESYCESFKKSGFDVVWAEPVFASLIRLFLKELPKSVDEVRMLVELGTDGMLHAVFERNSIPLVTRHSSVTTFSVDGRADAEAYMAEIRMAVDYFRKSFRGLEIASAYLIRPSTINIQSELSEMLSAKVSDLPHENTGLSKVPDDTLLARAAGACLPKNGSASLGLNLIQSKSKKTGSLASRRMNLFAIPNMPAGREKAFLKKAALIELVVAVFFLVFFTGWQVYAEASAGGALKRAQAELSLLPKEYTEMKLADISSRKTKISRVLAEASKWKKEKDYLTVRLNALARYIPENVELTRVYYSSKSNKLSLEAVGHVLNSGLQEGIQIVNSFVRELEGDDELNAVTDSMQIKSISEISDEDGNRSVLFSLSLERTQD